MIGRRCTHSNVFSLPVLIARGLDLQFLCRLNLVSLFLCLVFRVQKCSWSPIQGQAKADMDRKRKRKRNKAEDGESRRKRKEVFSDGVGVFNGEGPPVPIPNTEVKLTSADDTCLATSRENRSMPTQKKRTVEKQFSFFVLGVTYFARRTLQNTSLRSALSCCARRADAN